MEPPGSVLPYFPYFSRAALLSSLLSSLLLSYSLFSLVSLLCYLVHLLFSLSHRSSPFDNLFSLLSSLFSLRSSLRSIQRRGGFRVANWDPPPPACRGAGRVEYQSDFVKLSSEGPRAFRRPPPSCRIRAPQDAILEPPMASKMPSWSFRWPPDRQILQMSAKLC